jgi:hypothetical protein
LTTRQPPERILNYYQKDLREAGLVKVVNEARAAKEADDDNKEEACEA